MAQQKKQKFNPIILWRTRQYLIMSIGLIVLAAFILLFAAYPQVQAALELRSNTNRLRPQLENLEKKLAQLENVRFEPEFSQMDVINEAMPSKKPLLELLTNLSAISMAHQVDITEFQLSPGEVATTAAELQRNTRQRGDVDTLDVELSIQGSRDNVNQFLNSIEKISPFTTITQLTISTATRLGGELSTAKMATSTFFFTKPITTTVDSPLPVIAEHEKNVLDELAAFTLPNLNEQTEVVGGGLEDLFGVDPLQFE